MRYPGQTKGVLSGLSNQPLPPVADMEAMERRAARGQLLYAEMGRVGQSTSPQAIIEAVTAYEKFLNS